MAPKHKTSAGDVSTTKRQKKVMSLSQKVELLDRLLRSCAVSSTKVVTHVRDVHIERMEQALSIWIEDNTQKNMPLSGPLIREKAKTNLRSSGAGVGGASMSDDGTSSASSCTASRGWFHRFKEQYCLENVKLTGERASMDHEVAKAFPTQLARLIEEKGYLPE
uniref:tigger transposable element-derived protein 1-like n=1 Tax=Myxine glutinosa TaxID=7769 RepID=UPI00358FD0A3